MQDHASDDRATTTVGVFLLVVRLKTFTKRDTMCRLQHATQAGSTAMPEAGHLTANGQHKRWEAALGNIEDARVALDACVQQTSLRLPMPSWALQLQDAGACKLW